MNISFPGSTTDEEHPIVIQQEAEHDPMDTLTPSEAQLWADRAFGRVAVGFVKRDGEQWRVVYSVNEVGQSTERGRGKTWAEAVQNAGGLV